MSVLREFWQHHKLVVLAFVLGLCVAVFFLVRLVLFTVYWADPAHRNRAPEGWMTLGFVAHSWGIERSELVQSLNIDPARGQTLAEIAAAHNISEEAFLSLVAAAVAKSTDQ